MLEAVGMGIAMGNAKDEVKAKADFVCKSVEMMEYIITVLKTN